MIISSVVGSVGFYGRIITLLSSFVSPEIQLVLTIILTVFGYITMGGGISVIIGALVSGFSSDFAGRFIIGMGIGAGLVSLITLLVTSIYGGAAIDNLLTVFLTVFNGTYGLASVVVSIIGRMRLKD
ncbi:hypothetical protein LCGC14_1017940 [marine sediment metagenome]|uniref:Uncharacterized protein n=1 Tax=marine sediment metagenome TaxID=412755 RepID=A0A0F9R4E3_9ZZZZ|nr:hypothetical protein [archaeon]